MRNPDEALGRGDYGDNEGVSFESGGGEMTARERDLRDAEVGGGIGVGGRFVYV